MQNYAFDMTLNVVQDTIVFSDGQVSDNDF